MIHAWWEGHAYNDHNFGDTIGNTRQYGGGRPRIMAAMDALYGSMPLIFPFGAQYAWVNRNTKETFLYKMRLEDPETQYVINLAKPVAQLHARIGMLEMTDFEILSNDGFVQKTTFSDGTSVYANFGPGNSIYIDGIGEIPSESWKVYFK
jgi:hypothetical protein